MNMHIHRTNRPYPTMTTLPSTHFRTSTWVRQTVVVLTLLLCLTVVHAQDAGGSSTWAVHDQDANGTLNNIRGDLDKIYSQQGIAKYTALGDAAPDPDQPLTAQDLTQGIDQCQSRPQAQQALCQEIIQTQNAQMNYMVTMYNNAITRNKQLQDIETERNELGSDPNNAGALQNNTNKLLALNAQLNIDHQQMQSVMYAYQTRLAYMNAQQAQLAQAAASGNPPDSGNDISVPLVGSVDMGSLVKGLVTGVALKGALMGVQSPTPSGMKTLSTEQSNGW